MKLRKIISGGQTGADRSGLECAKELGLATGGTAPNGYRTEDGADLTLKDFGLIESADWNYQSRTRANVRDSDCTLWFGKTTTPGYACTYNACHTQGKPFFVNPTKVRLQIVCDSYEIVNIAGNRKSKYPEVVELVKQAFNLIREFKSL